MVGGIFKIVSQGNTEETYELLYSTTNRFHLLYAPGPRLTVLKKHESVVLEYRHRRENDCEVGNDNLKPQVCRREKICQRLITYTLYCIVYVY